MGNKSPLELEDADMPPQREEKKSRRFCCKCKISLPKAVWLTMTLMVLGGFAYHFSIQIQKYLSYPVRLNVVKIENYALFPDITVCPSTYFSYFRDKLFRPFEDDQGKLFVSHFFVKNMGLLWNLILFNKTSNVPFQKSYDYIPQGKFSLLPFFAMSNVSPRFADSLLECEYAADICDFGSFLSFFHPRYGLCYTFSPSNETLVDATLSSGLRMTLSYKDRLHLDLQLATRDIVPGATIFLHRRKSFPNMEYPLQSISYGKMMAVDFSYSTIYRLFTPKIACEDEKEYELCRVEPNNRRKCRMYTETPFTRQFVDRQKELNKHCDCVSEEWPIPASLKHKESCHHLPDLAFVHKGFTVAANGTISLLKANGKDRMLLKDVVDIDKVRKRYHCYKRIRDEMIKHTAEKRLCSLAKNDIKLSFVPHWTNLNGRYIPFIGTQERLGQHIIDAIWRNKPQIDKYNLSSVLFQKVNDSNKMTYFFLAGEFKSPTYMYRAFGTQSSRLYVYSSEAKSYVKRELYLYDGMFFLADTGGVLGLWVGFSLLSILDIIEMAIVRYRRKKAAKTKLEST